MRNRCQSRAGFTVIEMIVVIAIIVSLAGVIIPVVSGELDGAKRDRVATDLGRLANAIRRYIQDTGYNPTGDRGAPFYHWGYTNGDQPISNDFNDGRSVHLRRFLEVNDFGGPQWKGPYLSDLGADPWGHAYVVNLQGYYSSENVLVLCAGANGAVDTLPTATAPDGDDIVVLIK
jgi:prepilin-type N-terminal cleavage/methylation domain-containing protein